ncbi:MAG: hypothetical protein QOD59_5763 [Mycobacterium sp.]|jgi:hypothetical protein|nr:hypothetical protein [Mycobacterium sp.]
MGRLRALLIEQGDVLDHSWRPLRLAPADWRQFMDDPCRGIGVLHCPGTYFVPARHHTSSRSRNRPKTRSSTRTARRARIDVRAPQRRGPVITTISGQPVKQRDIDAHAWIQATIAAGVPADYRDMLALPTETVASDHYSRPTDDVEHVTGVPATNFADFVRRTDQQFEAVHQ